MPYVSEAQQGFFNANRKKLEKQGVDVDEWNKASKGMHLPQHVPQEAQHALLVNHKHFHNNKGPDSK